MDITSTPDISPDAVPPDISNAIPPDLTTAILPEIPPESVPPDISNVIFSDPGLDHYRTVLYKPTMILSLTSPVLSHLSSRHALLPFQILLRPSGSADSSTPFPLPSRLSSSSASRFLPFQSPYGCHRTFEKNLNPLARIGGECNGFLPVLPWQGTNFLCHRFQ